MRVALVGSFAFDIETPVGGVQTATANLIEGLRTLNDMEIHVVTLMAGLDRPIHRKRNGVTYHGMPTATRLKTLTLHMRERRTIKQVLREIEPDVVHAQDTLNYGYICLKSVSEYPLVLSIHGIAREERRYVSKPRDKARTMLTAWIIERYCVKNASHIVQPTRYAEEYFGSLISGRIYETGNAIDKRFFEINSEPESGRLLYSGRILPLKRVQDLLDAVAKVRDRFPGVVLRIAGDTPDPAYARAIGERIASNSLESNVILLGHLPFEQLAEEYAKCSLLVLPSGHENSPMVIIEAMAAGKAVVATRVGGIPYLVDEGETGFLVNVGDVGGLSDRILTILEDGELQSRMGSQAKQRVDRFRSQAVAEKVRAVYLAAIGSFAPHGRR